MTFSKALPVVLCAGFAGPVFAQSAQEGFYTNGYAELSYFDSGSGNGQTLGYSEATIGYNTSSGFGAEVGVDAIITEGEMVSTSRPSFCRKSMAKFNPIIPPLLPMARS